MSKRDCQREGKFFVYVCFTPRQNTRFRHILCLVTSNGVECIESSQVLQNKEANFQGLAKLAIEQRMTNSKNLNIHSVGRDTAKSWHSILSRL
jgi:hypothetical protein